jgi:di/tricarboxylate transporter
VTTDAAFVLVALAGAFALFVTERLSVDLVGLLIILALALGGILGPDEAFSGFANGAVITIATMMVLSQGLVRTGALDVVGRAVTATAGGSKHAQVVLLLLVVAALSAFLSNTAVALVFLPVVLALAARHGTVPSRLLIPLSFATILGGTCTLIGTSTNLLVSETAATSGLPPIGMFDFAVPGALYALTGLAFLALAGPRLLPRRASVTSAAGGGRVREFVTEVVFPAGGPLVGKGFQELLARVPGVTALMVLRGELSYPAPLRSNPATQFIRGGDILLLKGGPDAINALLGQPGVALLPELGEARSAHGTGKAVSLVELVVVPNSPLIGRTLAGVGFTRGHGGAAVLAVLRRDEHLRERVAELRLRMGDTLLAVVEEGQLPALRAQEDVLLVEGVESQVVHRGKAPLAVAILAAVVVLASVSAAPLALLALAGAVAMILSGCLPLRRAYNAIDLGMLVLIAGTIALSLACEKTGLVARAGDLVVTLLEPHGPHAVLAGLFLAATVLTALISNSAVAVLFTPMAVGVAARLGLQPEPFVYAVLFGASCDFCTPIGYQTNLLVYGPGGYRFTDYVRLGVPLTLVLFAVSMLIIPWWFPFASSGP